MDQKVGQTTNQHQLRPEVDPLAQQSISKKFVLLFVEFLPEMPLRRNPGA